MQLVSVEICGRLCQKKDLKHGPGRVQYFRVQWQTNFIRSNYPPQTGDFNLSPVNLSYHTYLYCLLDDPLDLCCGLYLYCVSHLDVR